MNRYLVDARTDALWLHDAFETLSEAAGWIEAIAREMGVTDQADSLSFDSLAAVLATTGFCSNTFMPPSVTFNVEKLDDEGNRPIAALRLEIADKALAVVAAEGDLEDDLVANWKRVALPEDREEELVDLLANLRHWCDHHGLDFASLDERARDHHFRETDPDAEGVKSVDYADIVRLRNRGLGITRVGKKWARQYADGTVGPIHHDTVDAAWLDLKQTVDALDRAAEKVA